jgi:hypothetical protein
VKIWDARWPDRLQRRSLFEYLAELLVAHTRGKPRPRLA